MVYIRQLLTYLPLVIFFLNYGAAVADTNVYSGGRDQRPTLEEKTINYPTLSNEWEENLQKNSAEYEAVSYKMDDDTKDRNILLSENSEVRPESEQTRSQKLPSTRSQSDYSSPNWMDTRWRYRKNITISASQVSADLTNFPVLIDLYDIDLQQALTSGNDIFFTNASGVKLAHEIELFDRFYSSTEAHLVAWVKANLSNTDDTTLSIYYGNPFAEPQENSTAVWGSDYAAVWHLNDDPTGTIYDSTLNDNDGSSMGSMTSNDQVNGLIDGCIDFDGINDYLTIPQSSELAFSSSGIVSGWFKLGSNFDNSSSTSQIILEKYIDDEHDFTVVLVGIDYNSDHPDDGSLCFKVENGPNDWRYTYTTQTSWSANTWYHFAAVINGNNSKIYINGVDDTMGVTDTGNPNFGFNADFNIGGKDADSGQLDTERYFNGQIDEVRVSSIIRSSEWISIQYQNQNNASAFYSLGFKENYESEHGWPYPTLNYRKNITIDHEKVETDLTNFPVLIDLYDTDLHEKAQLDGDDIIFTDTSGTKLDHEIENYIGNYNSTHAHLTAWVKVPMLLSSINTDITMYFGNSTVSNGDSGEETWIEYTGVWHLEESISDEGSMTDAHVDSTKNANHGNQHGNDDITGQISKAQDFDGSNDYIEMGDPDILDMQEDKQYTITGWFYWDTTINRHTLLAKRTDTSALDEGYSIWLNYNGDGNLYFEVADNDGEERRIQTTSDFTTLPTDWYYFAFTIDLNNADNWAVYINGIDDNGYSSGYGINYIHTPVNNIAFTLGAESDGDNPFDGKLDETRITSLLRSAEWLKTEFENQKEPNSFYSVGPLSYNDFTPPTLNNFGVDDQGTGTGKFWANITDNLAGVTSAFIRINETDYAMSNNGTLWICQPSIIYGSYYVYQIVNASDAIGYNLTTASSIQDYSFEYDVTAPMVDVWIYDPELGDYGTFKANVSEVWGEIDTVIVNVTETAGGPRNNLTAVMRLTASGYMNDTLEMESGTIWFEITVNDTAGNIFISTKHQGYVPKRNHPPTVSNLILFPDPLYSNEGLFMSYYYSDPDNDSESVETEIRWYKNNVLQNTYNNWGQIPAFALNTGDQWNVSVQPHDGEFFGELIWSSTITVQNTPPDIISLGISPNNPTNESILTCEYVYDDHDNNPENIGDRRIEWYRNGVNQTLLINQFSIPATETRKDEIWLFKIQVSDGTNYSSWFTSLEVKIGNTLPMVSEVDINEDSPVPENKDLKVEYTYFDYDDDPENESQAEIRWYKNGEINETFNDLREVDKKYTSEYDVWYYAIRVYDGRNYSNWEYSPSVSIGTATNNPPSVSNILITPSSPLTGNYLNMTYTYSDEGGSSTESGTMYYWYCNGIHVSKYDGYRILPANATTKGQEWHVKVRPKDGVQFGTLVGSTTNVTIGNTPPISFNLQIVPVTPDTTTNLIANFEYFDIDNDQMVAYFIKWYNDTSGSVEISHWANRTELPSNFTKKNEQWRFEVIVFDGEDWSTTWQYSVTIIQNSEPKISNISLSGGETTNENITLLYDFYDPDNDSDFSIIIWKIIHLGGFQPSDENSTTLFSSEFTAGDLIWVIITPNDGTDSGMFIDSSTLSGSNVLIQVGDTAPQINTDLGIPEVLADHPDDPLSYSAIYPIFVNYSALVTDIDAGESESVYDIAIESNEDILYANIGEITGSQYRWYKYSFINDRWELEEDLTSSFVNSYYLHKDDKWMVSVRPCDRYGAFGAWVNSTPIVIDNSRSTVMEFSWINTYPTQKDDITFSYDYFDHDSDPEDKSMTIIRWFFNNDTEIQAARNQTVLSHLFGLLVKNDEIYVVISPYDGQDYGINYTSSLLTIINAPPTASNVHITPFTPFTNDVLVLNWTYNDPDGDSQNVTHWIIQWYCNGVLVDELSNVTEVDAAYTSKDELWWVIIRVFDDYSYSLEYPSETVKIKNTPISISQVLINNNESTNFADSDLIISWSYFDQDLRDGLIDYSIMWFMDGEHQIDCDNQTTLFSSQISKDHSWYCVVQLFDGEDWSQNTTSQTVVIINKAPVATNIDFINHNYTEFFVDDEDVQILYDYFDVDGDDNSSFIRWFVNGTYADRFDGCKSIPANETLPGEIWCCEIIPFDGSITGIPLFSVNMTIESRPTIIDFGYTAFPDKEGHYQLWIEASDPRNPITRVEFTFLSKNLWTQWNGSHWVLNYTFPLEYLNSNISVISIVTSTVRSFSEEIFSTTIFDVPVRDHAPPRVHGVTYFWDDDRNPASITFIAEIEELGSGIEEVTLYYYFRPIKEEEAKEMTFTINNNGNRASNKFHTSIVMQDISMDIKWQNTTMYPLNATHWEATVEFHPESDVEILFNLFVADSLGNYDTNAYEPGLEPEGRPNFNLQTGIDPKLVQIMLIIGSIAFILVIIFSAVAIRKWRVTELIGLDIDKVIKSAEEITAEEIRRTQNDHTLGIVVSAFDQYHGPIPIFVEPEILKDNFDKLLEVADRSFSAGRFVEDFMTERNTIFEFNLTQEVIMASIAFGFSLERPEARGGAENITLNILIYKPYDSLISQFLEAYSEIVHEIHVLMDEKPSEKEEIAEKVVKIRRLITAIVLSYEKIYGSVEDFEIEY